MYLIVSLFVLKSRYGILFYQSLIIAYLFTFDEILVIIFQKYISSSIELLNNKSLFVGQFNVDYTMSI